MIFQSSRAMPGGVTATWVCWARPSVFTYVPTFSVYAAPGNTTSAMLAPASPWQPMYQQNSHCILYTRPVFQRHRTSPADAVTMATLMTINIKITDPRSVCVIATIIAITDVSFPCTNAEIQSHHADGKHQL